MLKAFAIFLLFFSLLPVVAHASTYDLYKAAVLRGVDKITGKVEELTVNAGEQVRFGTLYITARTCQKTPPEEQPESAAFVEIDELRVGADATQPRRWFSGWMFASSAALSPLQHPVYDVWVVDCKIRIGDIAVPEGVSRDEALTPRE